VTGLTSEEILAIVVITVVCIAMVGVGLLLIRRLRQRRDQIRGELSGRPEAVSDRAFNRIAMARREADVLSGQGTNVPRARELVGEAQAAFDGRQFDRAYALAQSAHETLVAARQRPPTARPPGAPAGPAIDPGFVAPVAAGPTPIVPPAPKIPAHRAEAQFQLRLLEEELARPTPKRPSDATARAQAFYGQAQQAFDRADYAESFRLGLKARRAAGGALETLAPPPMAGSRGGVAGVPPDDPAQAAEALASLDRCPSCGHPTRPEDAFCRGCGASRKAPACPKCGAPRLPNDTFCGRCGASFS
jgi:hypothetical protein